MLGKGLFGRNALANYTYNQAAKQPNALAHAVGRGVYPQAPRNTTPPPRTQPDYGDRVDGTRKGRGFLGEIRTPDGQVMTEYSIGVDWGEGEQEIPTVVPGLTQAQIDLLARGGEPTQEIIDRAIEHAIMRRRLGLSPFAILGVDYR